MPDNLDGQRTGQVGAQAATPNNPPGHGNIDQAIAAAEAPSVLMAEKGATIRSTGRPFRLLVPADLTHEEALAITQYVSNLPAELVQERLAAGKPQIIIPPPGARFPGRT